MTTPIKVDGAMGEGGGQVLRGALSLSPLTGHPFRLSRIRANGNRPGLRPQHLAAVQAAAWVTGAEVRGDRVGSEEIELAPRPVRSGDYFFDIGTAGATSLVLQTLLLVEIGVDGPLGGPATVEVRPGPAGPSDLT
jgi:RNA 3'-terminal phosphate cyclase (ATP)